MKTEAKTTQSRVKQLEEERQTQHQNLKKTDEELRDMKLKVQEVRIVYDRSMGLDEILFNFSSRCE